MTLSGRKWRCTAGEAWDLVALRVYGHEKYAADLLNANPDLSDRSVFTGGEILELPVVFAPEEADGVAQSAETAPWKE